MSNEQERSWYDKNREQILRGKSTEDFSEADVSYITKSELAKYFNVSKADFYATYDKLFKTLDKEEEMEE